MRLVVFGATGDTGLSLLVQGLEAGHEMTAFVRDTAKLATTKSVGGALIDRVRIVTGNVFDPADVAGAVRDHDAVLSCLGTRPWRHVDICSGGTRTIAAAMRDTGVRRLIVLSTQGIGDSQLGLFGRVGAALLLRKAFRDKTVMEDELETTDLDWIVVRPGLLTNGTPRRSWRVGVGAEAPRGGTIARADVAAFMLQQLTSETYLRQRPVIVH